MIGNNPILMAAGGTPAVDLTENLDAHFLLNNNSYEYVQDEATTDTGVLYSGDYVSFDGIDDEIQSNYTLCDGTADVPFTISVWYEDTGAANVGSYHGGVDYHTLVSTASAS